MDLNIFNKITLELEYPLDIAASNNNFIADISGNDSLAALIRIIEHNQSAIIIPSIIELACEYGERSQYSEVLRTLYAVFNNDKLRILPGIISDANDLWKAMVASNMQESINTYVFYSPCITCHLVLHLIRIKIANHLKINNVISGERELHADREKINQLSFVLDFYDSIYGLMGIKHHLPLRYITDNKLVQKIIDSRGTTSLTLDCLFSGNYYKHGTTRLTMQKKQLRSYVRKYLPKLLETLDRRITIPCKVIT